MSRKLISTFCAVAFISVCSAANASLEELAERVHALEAQTGGTLGDVELYGTLRPLLRVSNYDSSGGRNEDTDLNDNLSRIGVKGGVDISDGWSAFYHGAWEVNIGDDGDGGDLGDPWVAYVGFNTPYGVVALGRQWNPYYNIVAAVTDIYDHASSPFGWDTNGPFRTPGMVTYKTDIGNLNIQFGGRFKDEKEGEGHRHADEYGGGAGYQFDAYNAYLGVAFRKTQGDSIDLIGGTPVMTFSEGENADTDWWGVGGSLNPTDRLYLAFSYQDGEQDDAAAIIVDGDVPVAEDADKESLDIVASYDFGGGWNAIVGYFDSEDDSHGEANAKKEVDGWNLTLQKHFNSNASVWVEWLSTDTDSRYLDELDAEAEYNPYYAEDTFSIGFRYDFGTK